MVVGASLISIMMLVTVFGLAAFSIVSIVLFIVDGVKAKNEGRSRKTVYKVLFIIGMSIVGLGIVLFIAAEIIGAMIMAAM